MKAILLAGGLGTRMREETEFRPKPLVEIGGRPALWHIMKNLSFHGVTDFVVATGYKSELIKDYFLNYLARNNDFTVNLGNADSVVFHGDHDESNWNVTVAYTGQSTPTAGRILTVAPYLNDEPFMVLYGDGLANVNVTALMAFHQATGLEATVTTVEPPSRFGMMEIDPDGRVTKFSEKPKLSGWVNIGFFVMEPSCLGAMRGHEMLENEPLARLAQEGRLAAYRHEGFWRPMDTFREAQELNELWSAGQSPWLSQPPHTA